MNGTTRYNWPSDRPSEVGLLLFLEDMLDRRLPSTWQFNVSSEVPQPSFWFRPDAMLTLTAPNNRSARLAVEAKPSLYPKDAQSLTAQIGWTRDGGLPNRDRGTTTRIDGYMVLAPFLSEQTRGVLARANFGYADATGNLRVEVNDPPIFLELTGALSNPWTEDRPLQSLRGAGSARVIRALIDIRPPYQLRDLAKTANLPLATASRAVTYLIEEGLVDRKGMRGPIERVDWEGLLRRWTKDYSLLGSNNSEFFFDPRGPAALMPRLSDFSSRYAVTGSLAAVTKASVASPALAAVYVDDWRRASQELNLLPAESGGNVVLLQPSGEAAFERTWTYEGLVYASLSQVAADLLTSPGRGPTEGEALLEWMEGNEDDWRSPGSAPH